MGAGQSSGIEVGGSSMGYQVLRVYPNSPGSKAELQAYFDFIIAAGNTRFSRENGSLREILKASIDQKLKLIVYNTRSKQIREVEIVPSTSWGGNGLLGVSIKHSSFDGVDERVWHVLNVETNSPAFKAGLKSNEDYVIGADSILQESDDLYNLIQAHEGKALKLFVYNSNSDSCREVVCQPNSNWGGIGSLGCEFGHGYLHRIPSNRNSTQKIAVAADPLEREPGVISQITNVHSSVNKLSDYTQNQSQRHNIADPLHNNPLPTLQDTYQHYQSPTPQPQQQIEHQQLHQYPNQQQPQHQQQYYKQEYQRQPPYQASPEQLPPQPLFLYQHQALLHDVPNDVRQLQESSYPPQTSSESLQIQSPLASFSNQYKSTSNDSGDARPPPVGPSLSQILNINQPTHQSFQELSKLSPLPNRSQCQANEPQMSHLQQQVQFPPPFNQFESKQSANNVLQDQALPFPSSQVTPHRKPIHSPTPDSSDGPSVQQLPLLNQLESPVQEFVPPPAPPLLYQQSFRKYVDQGPPLPLQTPPARQYLPPPTQKLSEDMSGLSLQQLPSED